MKIKNKLFSIVHKLLWFLLYATPVVLSLFYFGSKALKKALITELNKQLAVPVKVQYLEFTSLTKLPYLGVKFHSLQVKESSPIFNRNLLQAEEVSLLVNPLSFLSNHPSIEDITIKNAVFRIYEGNNKLNYAILKEDTCKSSSEEININLKKINFSNVLVYYKNDETGLNTSFKTNEVVISGNFIKEKYTMASTGSIFLNYLHSGTSKYFANKLAHFKVDLEVNKRIKSFKVKTGELSLGKLSIDVAGNAVLLKKGIDLDLDLEAKKIDIQSITSLLPEKWSAILKDLRSKGEISLRGAINGSYTKNSTPNIDISYKLADVSIRDNTNNLKINKTNLIGKLTHKNSTWNFSSEIKEIQTKKSSIYAKINIANFDIPKIEFKIKGNINTEDISPYITKNTIEEITGNVLINLGGSFSIDAKTSSIISQKTNINGDIEAKRLTIKKTNNVHLKNTNINAHVNGNSTTIKQLKGVYQNTDFDFIGQAKGLLGYILYGNRMLLEGKLNSKLLDINRILARDSGLAKVDETTIRNPVSIDIGVDLNLDLNVGDFRFEQLKAQNLKGKIHWVKSDLILDNITFNAWEGTTRLKAKLTKHPGGFVFMGDVKTNDANINTILNDFNNFGQNEITSNVLWGKLTMDAFVKIPFDEYFNILEDEIASLSHFKVVNGRLKDYETLKSLSSFVKLEALEDVKFKELNNTIEIKNGVIYIPEMQIENSAMNLQIMGEHSFDNHMDYKISIKLTEILAGKSGWFQRKKERQLEDNKDGGLTAFVLISGTPDDLKIKYDRKSVKEKLKEEGKKERQEFFKNLRKDLNGTSSGNEENSNPIWAE